jgi:hypothetical protein
MHFSPAAIARAIRCSIGRIAKNVVGYLEADDREIEKSNA